MREASVAVFMVSSVHRRMSVARDPCWSLCWDKNRKLLGCALGELSCALRAQLRVMRAQPIIR
jgi:hypothetical protein